MQVFRTLNDKIHKEYGLDKCAKIVLKKGKLVHSQNLILDSTDKYKTSDRNTQVPRD